MSEPLEGKTDTFKQTFVFPVDVVAFLKGEMNRSIKAVLRDLEEAYPEKSASRDKVRQSILDNFNDNYRSAATLFRNFVKTLNSDEEQ